MSAPSGTSQKAAPHSSHGAMARQPGETMQSLVERRITDLHGKLHITSQQSQQWDQFAQVMRDNAREMDQVYKQRAEKLGSMSAVDNMQSYAQIEQQRAQDVQKLVPAFQTLYSSLSDQQKKTADQISAITRPTRGHAIRQRSARLAGPGPSRSRRGTGLCRAPALYAGARAAVPPYAEGDRQCQQEQRHEAGHSPRLSRDHHRHD